MTNSKCIDCGENPLSSSGCKKTRIKIDGVTYPRMTGQFIEGEKFKKDLSLSEKICDCCGAKDGNPHHFGCDEELCPIHKTSIMECDCNETVPVE